MSPKLQFSTLQILQSTSVVTFAPFVSFEIEEVLIPDFAISSFFVMFLSISSFHNFL